MKTMVLAAMAAVVGATAGAVSVPPEQRVAICVELDAAGEAAEHAEMVASTMFWNIGIKLEWHNSKGHFCETHREQVIVVELSAHTARDLAPGALAYALPYEGIHIEVFYDRLAGLNGARSAVLAHVLVHEITHVLQGINRHSETGIMRAHWTDADYLQMSRIPLAFTDEDVAFIYRGLHARISHLSTGALAGLTLGRAVATKQ